MTVPTRKPFSKKDEPLHTSTRRRRRKRLSLYGRADERSVFLGNLTHSATPSVDFFPLSILTGIILGAAFFFDLRPLYILAVLAAPFMAPLAGLSLATVSGSVRFFFHSLGALLIGAGMVFGLGALCGVAAGTWPDLSNIDPLWTANFTWADTGLLLVGTVFMAGRLYRNPQQNPPLASAALAYELYLPVTLAGYGLATHSSALLQYGLTFFAIHVSLASVAGAAVFVILGLRLRMRKNYSLGGSLLLTGIACAVILAGYGSTGIPIPVTFSNAPAPTITQTHTVLHTEIATLSIITTPIRTSTHTIQPSETLVPTQTSEPTLTGTATITSVPKPYLAVVRVSGAAGAYIRAEPAGAVVNSILNGMWVEIQPEFEEAEVNGAAWVYVRTDDGIEGWMMKSLLDIRATTPMP